MQNTVSDLVTSLTEQGQQTDSVHQLQSQNKLHSVHGQLQLRFDWNASRAQTVLAECIQQPPLKVVRAFSIADGATLVHLHNVSGGVLGGDHFQVQVDVSENARAQLTTTSATRIYRCSESAGDAFQINEIKVRKNALLEYVPDALIPFAGARYQQRTQIELAGGAGLFWWEIYAPGREASGEIFSYEKLSLGLDIKSEGRVVAIERNLLEPQKRPLNSLVRLGHYKHFASFYICRVDFEISYWLTLEKELSDLAEQLSRRNEVIWGISTLPAHGLVVRAVSINSRELVSGLIEFWQSAKRKIYSCEAILPRKVW